MPASVMSFRHHPDSTRFPLVAAAILGLSAALPASEAREWTSTKGSTITAEFESLEKDLVKLRREDGSLVSAPLASLVPEDRQVAIRMDRSRRPFLLVNAIGLDGGRLLEFLGAIGEAEGWRYLLKESNDDDPFGGNPDDLEIALKSWKELSKERILLVGLPSIVSPEPQMFAHQSARFLGLNQTGRRTGYQPVMIEPQEPEGFDTITPEESGKALSKMIGRLEGAQVVPTRKIAAGLARQFPEWHGGDFTSGDLTLIQAAMLHSFLTRQAADLPGMRRRLGRKQVDASAIKPGFERWPQLSDGELDRAAKMILELL